jgi:hypothetical protein
MKHLLNDGCYTNEYLARIMTNFKLKIKEMDVQK